VTRLYKSVKILTKNPFPKPTQSVANMQQSSKIFRDFVRISVTFMQQSKY